MHRNAVGQGKQTHRTVSDQTAYQRRKEIEGIYESLDKGQKKQLLDLLRQMALVAPQRATRHAAEQAADRLFRGVVAASSAVEISPEKAVNDDDPQG